MQIYKSFIAFNLVLGFIFVCCECRQTKNRKPAHPSDLERLVGNADNTPENRVELEPAPVAAGDLDITQPSKPRVRKPQYFVNGPVPIAPPLGTKEHGLRAVSTRRSSAALGSRAAPMTRNIAGRNRLPENEKSILLHAHNEFRARTTNPTAANMVQMKWSDELADMAQGWADVCRFAHGNPDNTSPFYYVGQNIWAGTGGGWGVYDMVESWYEEIDLYNYRTEACAGVCGHYTQLVWAESKHLGCALQSCSPFAGVDWNHATILVCNYGEGGNYVGQKPYIAGTPCSQCPVGYTTCAQGRLCAEPEMNTINPVSPSGPQPGNEAGNAGSNTGNSGGPEMSPGGTTACGGQLTEKTGEITSPGWPSPYTANQDCEWIIEMEKGETVTVHVTYMDIEPHNQCQYDYILITVRNRQGDAWRGTKYCGNRALEPITVSEGSRIKIGFHSDNDVHRGGFKAIYSKSGGEPEAVVEPCGGTLTSKTGSIKSPNYPNNYGENINCKWIFQAPEGKRIRIKFNQLDIEDSDECQYDKLILRLGNEKIPMTICGSEKPSGFYISVSNKAELHFITDGRTGNKGFTANYRQV